MPVKVNLGCGLNAADGWVNIDRSPNLLLDRCRPVKRLLHRAGILTDAHMAEWPRNIVMRDVRKRLPFEDGSVDALYSSHMLEHLPLAVAERVLLECRRVLAPGGVIRLALPDGYRFAQDLVDAGGSAEASRRYAQELNAHPLDAVPFYRLIARSAHQWQPTVALALEMLTKAGFDEPTAVGFREGNLPDLVTVEHREESIFVEAKG